MTLGNILEVFRMLLHQGSWREWIFARALAISHDGAKWRMQQLLFRSSGAFRMTVRKFRMVMRNYFLKISSYAAATSLLSHFAWLCENFAWSCETDNYAIPAPLYNFSHFFMFNPSPPPSIKLQSLVQVHFLFLMTTLCTLLHSFSICHSMLQKSP